MTSLRISDAPGVYNVREFGAAGDGESLDTEALQETIDRCHESGGVVVVPPGTYLTGTLYLKSGVNLHLCAGARLLGSPRREDYNPDDVFPENPVFSRETVTGAHLLIAYQADDVAITGEGTIDGNGCAFFEPLPAEQVDTSYRRHSGNFEVRDWRPGQMVFFCRCTNVTVRDVRLVNSPYWTLLLLGCTRAQIRGLSISNPPQTPNGDGIDIDCCRDVTVSDCIITTGDDSITLRGHSKLLGEHAQACRNVAITNCVLSTPCNAVRVGVGDGEICNCTLSNLIIDDTRTGISIVSSYSERSEHGVTIEDVHFSNITMDVLLPLNVILGRHARPPAAIRNVSFSHVRAAAQQGGYIGGNPGHRIEGIRLHEVSLELAGGDVDPQFDGQSPTPSGTVGVPDGLFVRETTGLRASGLQVKWGEVEGAWRHAIEIEDSDDVALTRLDAEPPPTESAGAVLRHSGVQGLTVSPLNDDD